jgi:hypothetical protein
MWVAIFLPKVSISSPSSEGGGVEGTEIAEIKNFTVGFH